MKTPVHVLRSGAEVARALGANLRLGGTLNLELEGSMRQRPKHLSALLPKHLRSEQIHRSRVPNSNLRQSPLRSLITR